MDRHPYAERARAAAVAWKATLPVPARPPAPFVRDGRPSSTSYAFCLPPALATLNLLPEVREEALADFATQGIAWWASIDGGPTNHLLSSQVQCVNALGAMAHEPDRMQRAFGGVLDIAEPLEIEQDRFVAFEYIGAVDHLGEVPGGRRVRGSMTTSIDAAIRYRTSDDRVEIALVEWKYTEDYRGRELSPKRPGIREGRYRSLWEADGCPVRHDVVPYDDLFVEPFYQLFRQQLLAHRMEATGEGGASVVRVVHVSPPGNLALRQSLNRASHRAAGNDVFEVWRSMLRRPNRFHCLDSSVFCDAAITSAAYVARYAHG